MKHLVKLFSCILMMLTITNSVFALSTSSKYPDNVNTVITQISSLQDKLKTVREENDSMQKFNTEVLNSYKAFKQSENVGATTDAENKTKKSDTFMKAKNIMDQITAITDKQPATEDVNATKNQISAQTKELNNIIKEAKKSSDWTSMLEALNNYYEYQSSILIEANNRNEILKQTKSLYEELKSIIG